MDHDHGARHESRSSSLVPLKSGHAAEQHAGRLVISHALRTAPTLLAIILATSSRAIFRLVLIGPTWANICLTSATTPLYKAAQCASWPLNARAGRSMRELTVLRRKAAGQ